MLRGAGECGQWLGCMAMIGDARALCDDYWVVRDDSIDVVAIEDDCWGWWWPWWLWFCCRMGWVFGFDFHVSFSLYFFFFFLFLIFNTKIQNKIENIGRRWILKAMNLFAMIPNMMHWRKIRIYGGGDWGKNTNINYKNKIQDRFRPYIPVITHPLILHENFRFETQKVSNLSSMQLIY